MPSAKSNDVRFIAHRSRTTRMTAMPVDHPASTLKAEPAAHSRKIAFAVGASVMMLALYAARLVTG